MLKGGCYCSKLSWIRLADGLPEYPQSRLSGSS